MFNFHIVTPPRDLISTYVPRPSRPHEQRTPRSPRRVLCMFSADSAQPPAAPAAALHPVNGAIIPGPLSPTMTGDRICSQSCWFKNTNAATVNQTMMWLGAYSVGGLLAVSVSDRHEFAIFAGIAIDPFVPPKYPVGTGTNL